MALPAGIDPSQLPAFSLTPANDDRPTPGPLRAGIGAGFHELLGLGGSAIQGVGKLIDSDTVANYGESVANNQATIAARVGRPDLEVAPWQQGGSAIAPWLEYQAAKLVPTLAGYGAATLAVPEAAVPAGLARLGAALPEFLGGGAAAATPELAAAAGRSLGKFVIGGGAFGGATGFGQAIQSASAAPGGLTVQAAQQAAAESPLYAAAGLVEPGFLRGALRGAEGNLVTRVLARGLSGAAVGSVQAGTLAALDQTFRPDLSAQDKMANIVNAAVSGAAVGGVFAGATGIRALKRVDPNSIPTDGLGQVIDQELNLGDQGQAQNLGRLGLPAPPTFVDSMGRAAVGSAGAEDLRATPVDAAAPAPVEVPQAAPALFGPEGVPDRGTVPGSTIVVGRRGDQGRFTTEPTGVEQPPVVPEDTSRAYRNLTTPELEAAANALMNKREATGKITPQLSEIAKGIDSELALRRNGTLTTDGVDATPAEAVSASANRRGTGEQLSAAPASVNDGDVAARITELTQGLKLPASLKDRLTQARSEHDIQDIVHDEVIVDGKGGKMRDALAQRVGMLDSEGRPTPMADEVSARKTPAGEEAPTPAADAMFLQRWQDDVKTTGQKDPAVRALKPTSEADAQTQIYRALGEQGVKSDADGLEKLAQKYGVLDDSKQLTPLALELAKKDPISTDDSVKAAQAQGFKGAAASMFDRGARAYTGDGELITKFESSRAGEAYQAGVKWAEDTNSVPKGALKKYEPSGYTGEITDEQRALGAKAEVKKAVIPPEVRQGQLVNEAIDNVGLSPAKNEGDIAQLKSMVRGGDIEGAMEGLRRVQRGESLFEQPDRAPAEPFKGETVTPGAPRLERTREVQPTKAATRADAEKAIQKYQVSRAVHSAFEGGQIDAKERIRLLDKLNRGRVEDVIKVVGTPTSRIIEQERVDSARPERRAENARQLQEMMEQAAREDEVPELQVDKNGILRAKLKDDRNQLTRNADMFAALALNRDNPKAILDHLENEGGDIGETVERFRKYLPDDLKFVLLHSDKMTQVGHENGWNLPPAAYYDYRTHTVAIDANETYPQILVHELGHAIIDTHIRQRTPIGREIESIFNQLKKHIDPNDYAATDADEFMAEFLARKDLRDYVQTVADQQGGRRNLFQRLWDTIRKAFGMAPQPLVEHILNLAEAAGGQRLYPSDGLSPMIAAPPRVSEHVKDTVGSIVDAVDKHIDVEGAKGVLRRSQLYATTIHHITEFYGKPWFGITREDGTKVNGVVQREQTIDFKEAIQQRHAQLIDDAMNRVYELANTKGGKKSFENINQLMQLTQFGIHPGRDWDQQIKEVRDNPTLKPLVQEARDMYRSLQAKGHVEIYNDLRRFNDVQMLAKTAMTLHDYVNTDRVMQGRIAEFANSPMRRFMDEQAREGYGLQEAHDFWDRELDTQTKALKDHADAFDVTPPKGISTSDHRQMSASMRTVREQINSVKAVRERLDAFPNFHLGRDGDYFVDMKLRLGKDGKVDPAAMAVAAERLKQYGYVVSPHSAADHVYFRVDSTVVQSNLLKAAEALQREGFVRSDVHEETKGTTSHAIISGKRSDDRIQSRLADQWTNRLVQEIKANEHLQEKDREFLVKAIRAQALDLTPDNNLSKVMTHRDNVPGFDPDMFRSYNSRAKISVDALAGMAVARDVTDSYTNMRLAQHQARVAPSSVMPIAQRNGMTDVIDELSRHDKNIANQSRSSKPLDQLQAVSGAFFLSANLAYPLVNLAQVPMIALPELGSKFGFLNAAKTLAGVTPEALRIVAAIAKNGFKVSASRAADAVLTAKALKDAGVSGPKAEFLMQVANRGGVDIGGASRELARNAKGVRGSKVDQTLRIASALGYYSETLSRLVVALASHKLHPEGTPVDEMAQNTVRTLKESMWDYSSPNTSTMLSRDGFLGKMTPLATQFMKYTAMLNEKLYREVHAALGGDAEARRFLLQHLAMTTVFAGTLGLPFAAVLSSTYDRLKDWVDEGDQPSDIQASFRNGLADVFGKGAAEVLARGLPRAGLILPGLDVDLSTRLGEQSILPFSQFIADRRDLKDSLKDLESRAWGAPSSMMLNMATGAGRVAQGDFEGGFRQMLPLGLSSMVKAYQMTDQGFTDSKGNVLPMTPSAQDILSQAVGFNPAQNAEYNEARSDQMQQQGLLAKQAGSMRSKIVDAITTGDHDKARELIAQAVEFDRANPAYGVLRGVESSIQRRQQQQAVSQRFGVPLGVNPKDMNAPRLTRYADVAYKAQ